MGWCYASAAVKGTSHIRAGTRLQDAQKCATVQTRNGAKRLIAVVADGAGSADFGGEGASIVCRAVMTLAREAIRSQSALPDDEMIWSWLDVSRDRIQTAARVRAMTSRAFATTLVMLMVSDRDVVTVHVGDGAIVARDRNSGAWVVLSAPQHGEYASSTYFVTDDPAPAIRIQRQENVFDAFAVFSDGIESLVLDSATGDPSAEFFMPMARPLEKSNVTGKDKKLSELLAGFLASERLNERTDDDKSLILVVEK